MGGSETYDRVGGLEGIGQNMGPSRQGRPGRAEQ